MVQNTLHTLDFAHARGMPLNLYVIANLNETTRGGGLVLGQRAGVSSSLNKSPVRCLRLQRETAAFSADRASA